MKQIGLMLFFFLMPVIALADGFSTDVEAINKAAASVLGSVSKRKRRESETIFC